MSSAFQSDSPPHLPFSSNLMSSTEEPKSHSTCSKRLPRGLFAIDKPRDRAILQPRKSNFNNRLNAPLAIHAASSAARNIRPSVSEDNYHRALNILPPEIIDRVAFFLPRDRDICNLDSTCLQTHAAISHPRSGIWIQRFSEIFDIPASIWGVGVNFQSEYKSRQWIRKLLKKFQIPVVGGIDAINNEDVIIEYIRELIDDSFAVASSYGSYHIGKRVLKNIKHLAEVTVNSFFLDNSMRFASNEELSFPQLQLYRLILTHLALDERAKVPHCFEYSQKAVYGHPLDFPLFKDEPFKRELNLNNLLHIVNFFKYHITNQDEHSLHAPFHALLDDEKPKAWDSPVKAGLQKLGTHWKGCSAQTAYLHNGTKMSSHLRGNNPGSHIYSDVMDIEENDDGFLSLHLDFSRPKAPWPLNFERHLNSEGGADAWNYHQFQGFGHDYEKYRSVGYVSALPAQDPQDVHEVHGFQRITMMKWADAEEDDSKTPLGQQTVVEKHLEDMHMYADLAHVDVEHWAYEGVVLPGGKIMLGRWWSPHETPLHALIVPRDPRVPDQNERKCTGPFIFWNIDGAESTALCEDCAL
ncbi:hypothetical protein MMC17_005754 [Xylographa soralifera]|nr:hypothetical protein [Xylographa soralifera]